MFEEENPGLKVQIGSGLSGKMDRIVTAIAGGEAPDAILVDGGMYSELAMKGMLAPLEPLMEIVDFDEADLARGYELLGLWQERRYAIPAFDCVPSYALVYNASLWDGAGLPRLSRDSVPSWETIADYSKKLTVWDSEGNIIRTGFTPMEAWHSRYYTISALFDAPVFEDRLTWRPDVTNPAMIKALSMYKELFFDSIPGLWQTGPRGWGRIREGKTVMLIHGGRLVGGFLAKALNTEVDATWAPHIRGQRVQRMRAWAFAIPTNSDHKAEAMRFIKFISTDPQALQVLWEKKGRFGPGAEFLRTYDFGDPLMQWYGQTVFTADQLVTEDVTPMKRSMEQHMQEATDAVFSGELSPEAALQIAQDKLMADWREFFERQQGGVVHGLEINVNVSFKVAW